MSDITDSNVNNISPSDFTDENNNENAKLKFESK